MRFDDSLETVLAADISSPLGMQLAWRQLVDLIGRRRVPAAPAALARLRSIRVHVPPPVRAATARGLAFTDPPAPLVRLFAEDELSIAAPVLRIARLQPEEWVEMLAGLPSPNRSILRNRRDLGPLVERALETYGPSDFVLPPAELSPVPASGQGQGENEQGQEERAIASSFDRETLPPQLVVLPVESPPDDASRGELPDDASLTALAAIALGLPDAAEAMRGQQIPTGMPVRPVAANDGSTAIDTAEAAPGTFKIADIVARIDAFQRHREEAEGEGVPPEPAQDEIEAPEEFRFETDARGIVRWVSGISRAALIGLSLEGSAKSFGAQVDGIVAGAFRRRASFAGARLLVGGTSSAAGQWRISAVAVFDPATGRFTGYRGTGRRPRADERAEPTGARGRTAGTDAVRQLVHELRTPTTAIAGFAEMIESELLGPVPQPYRGYATTIRHEVSDLLGVIDDLDTAARLDSNALELRPEPVLLARVVTRIVGDLQPLAATRQARLVHFVEPGLAAHGDERAIDRLVSRLLATMLAPAAPGETIMATGSAEGAETVSLAVDRPRALASYSAEALLSADSDESAGVEGAPLLGTGFALRLVRNLAVELGGSLTIGRDRLTLRLPAVVSHEVGQASTN